MAFFKEAPIKGRTRDRDAAKANVDRLAAKLNDAELAVIAAKTLAQSLALSGDDAGLDAAEATERAALHRLGTMRTAHADAGMSLALLESQIAEMLDKKVRAVTASEVDALATDLEGVATECDQVMSKMAAISGRAAMFIPEAMGLEVFASSSKVQVAPAVELVATLMRNHAAAVLNGSVAATVRQPDAIAVPVKFVAPITTRVFSMKAVKWSTPDGLRYVSKYAQVDLPPHLADKALKSGACVTMDSVQCRTFDGTHVPGSGNLADSVSLDDDAAAETALASPDEPAIQFERVDRGKPYQLRVAGGTS
jgi:hypothetical protein